MGTDGREGRGPRPSHGRGPLDAHSLAANRAGRLSARQRLRLAVRSLAILLLAGVVVDIAVSAYVQVLGAASTPGYGKVIVAPLVIVVVAVAARWLVNGVRSLASAWRAICLVASGETTWRERVVGGGIFGYTLSRLDVGGTSLPLRWWMPRMGRIRREQRWRVYYTPADGNFLVNGERLDGE